MPTEEGSRRICVRGSSNVELRPHQNIKENMDGFSHWGNFVYFNNAAAGRPDARLKIRYSIRLRPWALYATIVLFLLAAWRTARYKSIRPSLLFGHTAILLCIKVALGVFVVLAVIFGLSVLGGILTGYGLYPMYGYDRLYGLWPSLRSLIHLEPYVPPALFALSMAAAASSWLLRRSNIELPQRAICNEIKATEAWVRWGLPAILGLTFTSLILGAWSGNVTQLDVPYQNVAGLVPNSDAGIFRRRIEIFFRTEAMAISARAGRSRRYYGDGRPSLRGSPISRQLCCRPCWCASRSMLLSWLFCVGGVSRQQHVFLHFPISSSDLSS